MGTGDLHRAKNDWNLMLSTYQHVGPSLMCGAIFLLPQYAFIFWTGTNLPFSFILWFTHTHTHTNIPTNTHTHTNTQTQHKHTHEQTHTNTQAHTNTQIHTRTHEHTKNTDFLFLKKGWQKENCWKTRPATRQDENRDREYSNVLRIFSKYREFF